jgi:tyrosine decarboxylase MnfA
MATVLSPKLKSHTLPELRKILRDYQKKCNLYRYGRNFGMGMYPSKVALEAYLDFVDTNYIYAGLQAGGARNPFSGVTEMENAATRMMADILHGDANVVGNLTFGGTESNILAMEAARDYAREKRHVPKGKGNIVTPITTHPSIIKAGNLLGLDVIRTAITDEYTADVKAMRDAIDDDTVAVVSTCGTHTVGTIDPIDKISDLAKSKGIWHHVDAAWGGFICCWLKMAGKYDIPKFDFEIDGVWSMTVDPHKMLFAPMPCGGILYRNAELQNYAFFNFEDPLGVHGHYFTRTTAGSRTGGNIAAVFALLTYLGAEGYTKLALKCMEETYALVESLEGIPGLTVPIRPKMNLFAVASDTLDVNKISAKMREKGWDGLYTTQTPPSFRVVLLPQNDRYVNEFIKDLKDVAKSPSVKLK